MKVRLALPIALVLAVLAVGGYLVYQNTLVPVPLSEGRDRFIKPSPESGEDMARLEVLMPAGPGLDALLAAQSELTLIEKSSSAEWVGQLASGLQVTHHGRRWRITLRTGWPMQKGSTLDAQRVATALGPEVQRIGGEVRVIDATVLDLLFKSRQDDALEWLSRWRVPGTGPFRRQGTTLTRFDGFIHGRAGIAALTVVTDPALMESHAWAENLSSGRWAWTVFPGKVTPEDMTKVRLAPYDEFRMKDGSVWFLSRRLRRLRPNADDWTRTRLFGVWKGAMDLPYDPLGM
jgi:hypothetical protein